MENKNHPIKSINYGNFQFTEWEKPYQDKFIKSFSLACRIYNKEKGESETQSSIQLDKKQDISIVKYLIGQAFLGKVSVEKVKIHQYMIALDAKEDVFRLAKEYKDKNNELQYSTLTINYKADFLILLDLLERCLAYLIIPMKPKKSDNMAGNVAPTTGQDQTSKFVGELDDDIPF